MERLTTLQNIIYFLGAVLVFSGALLWSLGNMVTIYIYCIGAILFAAMQIKQGYRGKSLVIRRLRRQQIIGALLLVLTGALMLINSLHWTYLHHNEWMVCFTIAAFLECYTAFRIPNELKKEESPQ